MSVQPVQHSTFTIRRSYKSARERVFKAFSDPAVKKRWFAEGEGFQVESFDMDFRVGGRERTRFRGSAGPVAGRSMGNDSTYLDIVPNERIVLAYSMSLEENVFSASLATFEFRAAGGGTELVFTEQGAFFDGADGPQMREQGWTQLLQALAVKLEQ